MARKKLAATRKESNVSGESDWCVKIWRSAVRGCGVVRGCVQAFIGKERGGDLLSEVGGGFPDSPLRTLTPPLLIGPRGL